MEGKTIFPQDFKVNIWKMRRFSTICGLVENFFVSVLEGFHSNAKLWNIEDFLNLKILSLASFYVLNQIISQFSTELWLALIISWCNNIKQTYIPTLNLPYPLDYNGMRGCIHIPYIYLLNNIKLPTGPRI